MGVFARKFEESWGGGVVGLVLARASNVLVKRLVPGLIVDFVRRDAVGDCGMRMNSGREKNYNGVQQQNIHLSNRKWDKPLFLPFASPYQLFRGLRLLRQNLHEAIGSPNRCIH